MKILKELKKSEFVIYAIALMLVTAGYFSYTTNIENKTIETSYTGTNNEAIQEANNENEQNKENKKNKENNAEAGEQKEHSNIGDATLVNSGDVVEENIANEENVSNEVNNSDDINSESKTVETANDENTTVEKNDENNNEEYFVSSKLERDKNFASMISTYSAMLENSNVSETQKGIAMQEITKINENKNAIMICENLISTKGFENCVIFINDNSVNVVVQKEGGLTTESVAQIQNIVSREIGTEIENIHITEK